MPALIACSLAALVGLLLYRGLLRRYLRRHQVSGRITAYVASDQKQRKERSKPRVAGWRGLWQAVCHLAPRGLSERYNLILPQADLPLKGEEIVSAIGVAAVLGAILGGLVLKAPGWPIGFLVGAKLPGWWLRSYIKRRLHQAESQLVDFLTFCANAMRAGHSLLQALELAAREMPDPLGAELTRTLREVSLGLSVEDALLHMVDRMPSADLDLMITSVLIQRQVGGDLSSILDSIAATVRARQQVKLEVRTVTAQGRLSGLVLSLLPVVLALGLNAMNPDYLSLMWTNPIGIFMLGYAVVSLCIGIVWMNKASQVEL